MQMPDSQLPQGIIHCILRGRIFSKATEKKMGHAKLTKRGQGGVVRAHGRARPGSDL